MATDPPEPDRAPHQPDRERRASFGGRGRPSRRVTAIVAGVCACGIAAGLSLAFVTSGGQAGDHLTASNGATPVMTGMPGKPAGHKLLGGPTQAPGPTATRPAAASPPAVTSDGIAKTALTVPAARKSLVVAWKAGTGGADLSVVTARTGAAMQAAGIRRYDAAKENCAGLASSVKAAQAGPAIPVAAMQTRYGQALGQLASGAAECQSAITVHASGDDGILQTNQNGSLLSQALAKLAAGSTTLYNATAQIRVLGK